MARGLKHSDIRYRSTHEVRELCESIQLQLSDQRRRLHLWVGPGHPLFGLVEAEIDAWFADRSQFLSEVAVFGIIAAAEGHIRELSHQHARRGKTDLDGALKKLFTQRADRVRFEDLLACWTTHQPQLQSSVGQFKQLFPLRHWIAHGRYWPLNDAIADRAITDIAWVLKRCGQLTDAIDQLR